MLLSTHTAPAPQITTAPIPLTTHHLTSPHHPHTPPPRQLPKLVIAAVTLVYASGYVLAAETNEDIILNAVAAVFILDIDDYAYHFFVTKTQQILVEGLPSLGLVPLDEVPEELQTTFPKEALLASDDAAWQFLGGFALAPALFGIAAAIYQSWCEDGSVLAVGLGVGLPVACLGMSCFACRLQKPRGGSSMKL